LTTVTASFQNRNSFCLVLRCVRRRYLRIGVWADEIKMRGKEARSPHLVCDGEVEYLVPYLPILADGWLPRSYGHR
jgi:hypothetical protein